MARPGPAELELAALAHRLWCERMAALGWRSGPTYDEERRTHDALVPFEELGPVDQRSTALGVPGTEIVEMLRDIPGYTRGVSREFALQELRFGLHVTFTGNRREQGTVESWEADPDWPGCVRSITVRWESGEVIVHPAAECEVARVE